MNDEEGLGFRFWARLSAVIILCGLAGLILMLIFTRAWYAWGLGGAFLLFAAVLLGFGWFYDRRQVRKYGTE